MSVMPIELLTNNHKQKVMNAFKNSQKEICIISPFLSESTAKKISEIIADNHITTTFITRFDHNDFLSGANSIHGLHTMLTMGVEILAVVGLHTKLYLIDDDIGILGSANFTESGLNSNVELSLYIENEPELLKLLHDYFSEMKNICESQEKYITGKMLSTEEKRVLNEKSSSKSAGPCISHCPPFGAKISDSQAKLERDFVQDLISDSGEKDRNDHTVWIKFEATSRDRCEGREYFLNRHVPADKTFFPKRPKRIAEGDLVYIAVHSYDAEGSSCAYNCRMCKSP